MRNQWAWVCVCEYILLPSLLFCSAITGFYHKFSLSYACLFIFPSFPLVLLFLFHPGWEAAPLWAYRVCFWQLCPVCVCECVRVCERKKEREKKRERQRVLRSRACCARLILDARRGASPIHYWLMPIPNWFMEAALNQLCVEREKREKNAGRGQ